MNARNSNIVIIVLVLISTLGTVFALFFGERFSTHESYRNDVYSFSAIGHRGFHEVLKLNFPHIEISQNTNKRYDFLFMIEPNVEESEDEFQERVGQCITCILVLPKRLGYPTKARDHILKYNLIESRTIEAVLNQFLVNTDNLRLDRIGSLDVDINIHNLPSPKLAGPIQLVQGVPASQIIYGSEKGALIFRESVDDSSRIVVSDPDLLANHGIDEEENYKFVVAFLNGELGSEIDSLAIDETMHGYRQAPSFLRLLTTFPLSIFTIQLLFILLFVTWRGLIIFGRPSMRSQSLDLGAKTFIENTASLFSPNHAAYLGRQYANAAMSEVASSLNAPRQLSRKELISWLDEQTAARGFSFRISEVLDRCEDFDLGIERWNPKDIVTIAQQVDQWRNRMRKE